MITRNCNHCGYEYTAEQTTSKYCSDSCKTLANRQRRKNEEIAERQQQEQAMQEEEKRQAEELDRQRKEKIEAEQAETKKIEEQKRIDAWARIHQQNQLKRTREAEKRRKELDKSIKESRERFQLRVLGIAVVASLGYHIFKPKKINPENVTDDQKDGNLMPE